MARATGTLSYLELVCHLSDSMQMIFMDCDENASSRKFVKTLKLLEHAKPRKIHPGAVEGWRHSMGSCVRRCTLYSVPLLALGTVHARRRSSVAQEHSAVVQTHLLPMSSFLHGEVKRGAGCMTRIWSLHKTMCSCIAHIAHKICTAMLDDKRNAYL